MYLLKAENINKVLGKEHILKNISLTINEGEFVAIIGPSGSGKSTLLYILGLLDTPTEGNIYIQSQKVDFKDKKRLSVLRNQKLGFIFQFHYLINELSVYENVMVPMLKSGKDVKLAKKIVFSNLEKFGLKGKEHRKPFELSGGEQQRVSIARAISNDPILLIADEPTGNLDSKNTQIVMDIFNKLNQEGKTIIMVTHNLELTTKASRIIKIKDGEIIEDTNRS